MQNQTLIQYFHWYYNEVDNLWTKVVKEAPQLAQLGITGVWLPPAYKGTEGANSIGYDTYDLFDLGEFDQKNSINTKYGNKEEYLKAISCLKAYGIIVLADTIFNHKTGADELEHITVRKVDEEDRNKFISDDIQIDAWTKFTFPGRNGTYSSFIWDYRCFSGIDWAQDLQESAIYTIQNEYGEGWEDVPSTELGNYDYLMFADIDFRNPAVREELHYWGKWYYDTCGVDGFRLDAVKHISPAFIIEWIDRLKESCQRDFFFISENWNIEHVEELEHYIEITGGRTHLFDSLLHHNFYTASIAGKDYELDTIFNNTLVQRNPNMAITFVDNHDSQPLQALESYVEFWFRPLAYALILLREQGCPCVFYIDLYEVTYEDKGEQIALGSLQELPTLLNIRKSFAYGEQREYLDHHNCIGWTRAGTAEYENSGIAVLMSNGEDGFKEMEMGLAFAGKTFIDTLGKRSEEVTINDQGSGEFLCLGGSVSVWVLKG
jgi:alpha-amylase